MKKSILILAVFLAFTSCKKEQNICTERGGIYYRITEEISRVEHFNSIHDVCYKVTGVTINNDTLIFYTNKENTVGLEICKFE